MLKGEYVSKDRVGFRTCGSKVPVVSGYYLVEDVV
jgi:hypothetical protein